MQRLSPEPRRLDPADILAFACVRDEALRLPWFLDYHRRAGVDRFFIVDNGSVDGSTAFLLEQPDVVVYYCEQSYAAADHGVAWTNELAETYADGHWALTLDADELLVYPACEELPLRRLVEYLDADGADALRGAMIDMYPRGPIGDTEYRPGQDFLDACPFFDSNSYCYGPAGRVVRGGPRHRVFWEGRDRDHPSPFLPKIPLVRWRPGRAYEASTHVMPNIRAAELTGVLLHFKFFQDFAERVTLEAVRKEHFEGARQYAAYAEIVEEEPELSLYTDKSERYTDSNQLVELGLVTAPASYRQFVAR